MSAKKPYEQFGPYILFKKLEADALGDLFRAARIEERTLGPMIALHRLTGGNREALASSATAARPVTAVLNGTSFVREQLIDVVDGVPIITHDYAGGRSLRHVVNRARGGSGVTPNPIPLDQAIAISERVALSLATTAELRYGGERLFHGALVPHFVWINDDGEIRVAGQQLGKGILASLTDSKIAHDVGRYFSPEYQHSREPSKSSEVYALGAILFLVVTGHEPPDPMSTSAFMNTLRAAKTMAGTPIPDDIRKVLEKSLSLDPSVRFAAPEDMRQALSALSANYSATTFNLAFYLSNLLKKEMESEATERERESKVNIAPYLDKLTSPGTAATDKASQPMLVSKKNRVPVAVAAGITLAIIAAGAYFTLGMKNSASPAPTATLASAVVPTAPSAPAIPIPEPLVASPADMTSAARATDTAIDEVTRKKAFEDAVKQKLNEEMMKLQSEYTRQLQRQQSRNAPVLSAAAPPSTTPAVTASVPVVEERVPSAAQLDLQRRELFRPQPEVTATQAAVVPPPVQQQTPAVVSQSEPAVSTPPPPSAPAEAPAVREGDVVDYGELDKVPTVTRVARPVYPPMAARQRIETTVMLSILVSETGDVAEVKVLRGDHRFGFNDAAISALRRMKYTSPMKDGKRVRTWIPQMIQFKP